jgi:dihydrofolate synthase/folylpolyglutamate synthase
LRIKNIAGKGIHNFDRSIQEGLETSKLPGRFELLHKNPYLIIDALHKFDSSKTVWVETIQELFPQKKVTIIFGASEDKDIPGMMQNFIKIANRII